MLRPTHFGPRQGSVLVLVLIVAVAVCGMSAALVSTSIYRQSAARAEHERERAFGAAMSGLDVALYELQERTDLGGDGIGAVTGATEGCEWTVNVTPEFTGAGEYTLHATGRHGPMSEGIELVVSDEAPLRYGLFGRDSVTTTGGFGTDSYDSSTGTYASQVVGDHAGDLGSISSNGDITVSQGMIHGDATPGPGSQVLGSAENVTGSTAPGLRPLRFPSYEYAPEIPTSGPWNGAGTLTSGAYRFSSLNLRGGSVLVIEGDVSLSVDVDLVSSGDSRIVVTPGSSLSIAHGTGRFVLTGGGIVNESQAPSQVTVSSATTRRVEISGGSHFYGVVYAPDSEFVSNGGTHFYGAIIGDSIKANGNGGLHFDQSLDLRIGGTEVFTIRSTRRIAAEDV
jgi:type II secretory pathway pseudopilin PulG